MIRTFMFNSLIILLPALFLFIFKKGRNTVNNLRLPPSPPRLPLIGNLHQLGSLPHVSLCALARRYGPIMLLHLGQVPIIVISSSELAKQVMKDHDCIFANRPFSKMASLVHRGSRDIAFAPYGEYWKQARKLCVTRLLNANMVQSFLHVTQQEVNLMMDKITQSSSTRGAVNLSEVFRSFSSNVISRAVSNEFCTEDMKRLLLEVSEENSNVFGAFNIEEFLPVVRYLRIFGLNSRAKINGERWSGVLEEVINRHTKYRSTKEDVSYEMNRDIVDVLLSLENDSNREFLFTRDEIKSILIDMFAAGTDTSYVVLEYAMAELIQNPKVMEKLKDEVRGVTKDKHVISKEDLGEMSYLKAVIKEVLRLHPPGPFLLPRESMKSCQLAGYHIPIKTKVSINACAIGRDPNVWEEPNTFKPERFIGSSIDFKGNHFQFLPFGAGRRICPGMHFAVQTLELALANLVNKFEWAVPSSISQNGLNMKEKFGLLTSLADELVLVPTVVPSG